MEFSQKRVDEMKKIYKDKGRECSDAEAQEALRNLTGYFNLVWDMSKREAVRNKRLENEPEGFSIDGTYTCKACGSSMANSNGWYDKHGMKCLLCQKALNDGVIPSFIFVNDNSFFKMWQMKDYFELRHQTVKKMIREGELVAREILNDQGKVHEYIFLKKENPRCINRYDAVRKSYDRNHAKKSRVWEKKTKKELLEEYRKKFKK